MSERPAYRIGVDTGGTFTDLVLVDREDVLIASHKRLSTPDDPAEAVLAGIESLLSEAGIVDEPDVVHGSTVATNALLEGKTARSVLITTAGFEDVLLIARQHRPDIYALVPEKKKPLIDREMTIGVRQRTAEDGRVVEPLGELQPTLNWIKAQQPEAIAVCLLHSYANPEDEKRLGEAIRERFPDVPLTLSHALLPEMREYERTATCAINAAVAPKMRTYLGRLAAKLGPRRLSIMASHAGTLSVGEVCEQPVRTILSGPAGGALGAIEVARSLGYRDIITFDMGGTSTDVALLRERPKLTTEGMAADLPVRLPMVDLHTVGAGGGSIAWMDQGGALRVGPQSCGASPGPACYGQQSGDLVPTVTDAHAVLGNLPPDTRLAGSMPLNLDAAESAIASLADKLKLSVRQTADGILAVAEATMARAIRKVSLEQGHDPAEHALVTFGGAGGLHACRLAEELGIHTIIVPAHAGLLSAVGMLTAPRSLTFSRSVMRLLGTEQLVTARHTSAWRTSLFPEAFALLDRQAASWFEQHEIAHADRQTRCLADLRYQGQSFEIFVELASDDPILSFQREHERLYGYCPSDAAIEVVTLRYEVASASHRVRFRDQGRAREVLGPDIIRDIASTLVVRNGWRACLTEQGHAILRPAGGKP
ncbi:hydantoinase/oxoprolinase family protein [Mucisphaera sp.]|uniref:hydantoinase/oxoprolinase family protein n=1 Tax=Mucisphaera sp. TaxID=2913024 RepID=UPI003D0CDBB3